MLKENIKKSILNRCCLIFLFYSLLSCTNSNIQTSNDTIIHPVIEDYNSHLLTFDVLGQEWLCCDLSSEVFQNGDSIKFIDYFEWDRYSYSTIPLACKYSFVNDNSDSTYVYLYNWYAITDKRNIAPKGFRIATENDYETLFKNIENKYKKLDILFLENENLSNKCEGSSFFNKSAEYKIVRRLKKRNGIYTYWTCSEDNKQLQIVYYLEGQLETGEKNNVYTSFMEMYKSVAMPAKCIKSDCHEVLIH